MFQHEPWPLPTFGPGCRIVTWMPIEARNRVAALFMPTVEDTPGYRTVYSVPFRPSPG
jgi:hypothetical protein